MRKPGSKGGQSELRLSTSARSPAATWLGSRSCGVRSKGSLLTVQGVRELEADQLLRDVMSTRGYPVTDFEQRAADISVDHPLVIENYRKAHEIALRQTRGEATTEDLRQAMIHYRTLFEDLTGEPELARVTAASA